MIFDARRRAPTRSALNLLLWWEVIRILLYVWLWALHRLRCVGAEFVPRRGPVIYVSNHQSYYDPPIVGCLVTDRPFVAMARASLFRSKVFSWIVHRIGAIPVEQDRADLAAIRAMITELRGGGCVLIFPEGQRTPDGAVGQFSRGLLTIIKRAKAPVVPVAIEGAFDVWPRARKYPRLRGRIAVRAGAPIAAEELLSLPQSEALDRMRRAVETLRLELRAELRERTKGRYPAAGPGDGGYWEVT